MSESSFRLRVRYVKQGRLRYLGHLELIHTIDRCVRRSGLPYALTQGFSPRMKMQFTGALPTGASSCDEAYDLYLNAFVAPQEALARLKEATPVDLEPIGAEYVDKSQPSLESYLTRSSWVLELIDPVVPQDAFDEALARVCERGKISFMRGSKEKTTDLATTFVSCSYQELSHCVELETRASSSGSLRPSVFVEAVLREAGLLGDAALAAAQASTQAADLQASAQVANAQVSVPTKLICRVERTRLAPEDMSR